MDTRRSRCAALAVLLVPIWVAACSDRDLGLQSPTAPLSTDALRLSADPSVLVPQFLSREDCPVRPAFRGRLNLSLSGGGDQVVDAVRFEFADGLGRRVVPTAFPLDPAGGASVQLPSAGAVQFPTAPPIPIPGFSSFTGLVLNGSRNLPVLLEFACGTEPVGALTVTLDTSDARGRLSSTRTSISVRR